MKTKIIMDSAGDIRSLPGTDFSCIPLTIHAGDQTFVDNTVTVADEMVDYLKDYQGTTSSACPSVGEYLDAFGDAEEVYCLTITSQLSGSYNAATAAAGEYLEAHPERRVHVFDTLTAGPEMLLLAEKLRELLQQGNPFDRVIELVKAYQEKTRLLFSLESLKNLANNGRIPHVVAKAIGILGIRMLAKASEEGTIQPIGKARGEKKVLPEMLRHLMNMGYNGGKMRITHCRNESGALALKSALLQQFVDADITVSAAGALCSFYAEEGGLLVGFEVM